MYYLHSHKPEKKPFMRIEGEWNKVITLKPTSDKVINKQYHHHRLLYLVNHILGRTNYHRYIKYANN